MLCTNCLFREYVESSEIGTVYNRCAKFKVNLMEMGWVKKCTDFEAKDLPYLFSREAWRMEKNDNGVWEFFDPSVPRDPETGRPYKKRKPRKPRKPVKA